MTAFAPRQSLHADEPHQSPPPLQQDPFAHQLTTPTAAMLPDQQQQQQQQHRQQPPPDFRPNSSHQQPLGPANGNAANAPMPVPAAHGRMRNGHAQQQGANLREMGFAGPRSPPNNKSTCPLAVSLHMAPPN